MNRGRIGVVASHLIPRHIGSDGTKSTVEQFVGVTEASGIYRSNLRIGIILVGSLDSFVDLYQASFYHITTSH